MTDTRNSALRPAASLTGALLARHGGARPPMRRQPIVPIASPANYGGDLGWSEVGDAAGTSEPVLPEPIHYAAPKSTSTDQSHLLGDEVKTPIDQRSRPGQRSALPVDMKRKVVAFTLRLDAERHLRLRLLSVLSRRSAQRLLIEALDDVIAQSEALNTLMKRTEHVGVAVPCEKKRGI